MISAQEFVILFIAAVVVASIAVYTLSTQVKTSVTDTVEVGEKVSTTVASDFEIISVNEDTNTDIYIKGISGEVNISSAIVLADGAPGTVISSSFLRDSDGDGKLDLGDAYTIKISGSGYECIIVDAPEARALWGRCT